MFFKYMILVVCCLSFGRLAWAQEDTFFIENRSKETGIPTFDLEGVGVMPDPQFANRESRRNYMILKRKVIKIYPYALMVADRVTKMRERVSKIKSSRLRAKYIRRVQSYFEDKFTEDIENMTQSEGRILCKLIYRELGITMYDVITEFRSGWTAFWWNATAWFFNVSLKAEYHPDGDAKDKMIEGILQRAILHKLFDSAEI